MSMGVSLGMDRNVLHAIHRLRAVEGITQDAVAVKADLEEVQDMLEAGLDYTEVVKRLAKLSNTAQPNSHTTLRSSYAQYESMQDHSLEMIDGCC